MINENRHLALEKVQLNRLIEANEKFAKVESLQSLVPELLSISCEVTGAEAASFFVYDQKDAVLRFEYFKDERISDQMKKDLKGKFGIPIGEGIAGRSAQRKCAILIEDAQKHRHHFKDIDKITGNITRSILAVPVTYKDDLYGVLEVVNSRNKPWFDLFDKEILICLSNLVGVAIFRNKLLKERLRQHEIQIQLDTATKIQSLFRPKLPDLGYGSQVWAKSEPAKFVGGDLYDIIPMPNSSWLVYVADVSDKGLPAALIMAAVWYRIRSQAHFHNDICSLLEALNFTLYDLLSEEGYFLTIFIGRYWPEDGKFEYVNGGHLPAINVVDGRCKLLKGHKGISLGVFKSGHYMASESHLSKNQSILIMTDGILEAMNERNECFGLHRLFECIQAIPHPPYGIALAESIDLWQNKAVQHDDKTILEIWRDP